MQSVEIGALLHRTFLLALELSLPALLTALTVGVLISLFQAVTQISETTLVFVPKLLALAAAMLLTGPMLARTLCAFGRHMIDQMIVVGGS